MGAKLGGCLWNKNRCLFQNKVLRISGCNKNYDEELHNQDTLVSYIVVYAFRYVPIG